MTRSEVKRRIAALRKLTMSAGCSESEAMAAAEKAAELLRSHGLSESDLVIDEQDVRARSKGLSVRDHLWAIVARCTNTAHIFVGAPDGKGTVTFIGQVPGPEISTYLYTLLNRAIDREIALFKLGRLYKGRRTQKSRKAAVHDFTRGLVARLGHRLLDLFAGSISKTNRDGARAALAIRFPNAKQFARPVKQVHSHAAVLAGHDAANNVHLAHGVGNAQGAPLAIGRLG